MFPIKPSQTTTSQKSAGRSLPSQLPMKFSFVCPEQLERLLLQFRALGFLAAVVQQRHARGLIAEQVFRVDGAHRGELHEHFGRGLGIGTRIADDEGIVQRDDGGQHRAADAADAADHQRGAGEQRAGIAAGDQRVAASLLEQTDGERH